MKAQEAGIKFNYENWETILEQIKTINKNSIRYIYTKTIQMRKIISVTLLLASISYTTAQETGIKFHHDNWENVLAEAKKENKLIFLDAYTTWCGPCKWMAKNIFTNDTVARFYNEKFICAKIDMEKGEGMEIAKTYNIRNYPTLLYINADGSMAHRVCGSKPAQAFIQDGKDALNSNARLSSFQEKFDAGTMKSNEVPAYLNMLENACMSNSKEAALYLDKQKESDLLNRDNWNIIRDYLFDVKSTSFIYMQKNQKAFADKYTQDSIDMKIEDTYVKALGARSEKKDDIGYDDLKSKVKSSGLKYADKIMLRGDINHYGIKKDWNRFAETAINYFEKYKIRDASLINKVAWKTYENVEDKGLLTKMANYSKTSTEIDDNYAYNDTYAALLFKAGNKIEAQKAAEHAIELGKKSNDDVSDTEELLVKIKALK